ncbi:MAG TPA: hypothetical protein VMU30_01620 [Bacteroidota bacterium]|nr:hypothetical protein [Bacteroidota bacterium]
MTAKQEEKRVGDVPTKNVGQARDVAYDILPNKKGQECIYPPSLADLSAVSIIFLNTAGIFVLAGKPVLFKSAN